MAAVPYIWFRGKRMTAAFRDAILAAVTVTLPYA